MARTKSARRSAKQGRRKPTRSAGAQPAAVNTLASQRFGPLYLFRKAVLNDPHLQERLRSAEGCRNIAAIANEYLRSHVKITVSPEFERSTMRHAADSVFKDFFHITADDLNAYLAANTNAEGEFLLGHDELAMVAGSSRIVSDTNTCSYGSGCGSCQCSSSLACVCK